jgi:predicted TIM-barrel fold metal-dependent hydrolase
MPVPLIHLRPRRRDVLKVGLAGLTSGCALGTPRARAEHPAPPLPPVDVDIHCHTFCAADLPIVGFVAHYIPGLTDLSRELTRWPEMIVRAILKVVASLPNAAAPSGASELAWLQAALATPGPIEAVPPLPAGFVDELVAGLVRVLPFSVGADTLRLLARYLDTLYLVAHPRAALASSLADAYPSVSLFTPCLVDYDAWSDDRAPTPLATQIQVQALVARLSMQDRIGPRGARLHPFVAFDPRREAEGPGAVPGAGRDGSGPPASIGPRSGALEMVRYAVESAGFLGVKVYPAVGFAPLDNVRLRPREALSPRLDAALAALYATCQAQEIPITTHASVENEFGLGLRALVAPERWRPVLERFPTLRLNFGHFGHDYGIDARDGVLAKTAWMRQAAALMQAYPNVYADLSGSALPHDPAYAARFLGYLRDIIGAFPRVTRRLMYGSDWWLNRLDPGPGDSLEGTRAALASLLSPEEVADVMGRNALRFLGFLDEENRPRPGASARRLRRFYGPIPPPSWLAEVPA